MKVVMFTKNIDSLPLDEAVVQLRRLGFDGADVTVRPASGNFPAGRVLPERVTRDLPSVVSAFRDGGLEVPMISTGISAAEDDHAVETYEAAAAAGVGVVRLKLWPYAGFGTFASELDAVSTRLDGLERLSRKTGVQSVIHVHSGSVMSANPFVVWQLIKDRDTKSIGAYVDFEHLTLESAPASRAMAVEYLSRFTSVVAVKDFVWEASAAEPYVRSLRPIHVPVGDGVVPWAEVFAQLAQAKVDPIISVHSEYFGASSWRSLTVPELLEQTKADVAYLRSILDKTLSQVSK